MVVQNTRIPAHRNGTHPARRRSVDLTLAGVLLSALPALASAQQTPTTPPAPASALPVRDVTLFSSGVSYTLREGEVTGDASIPLTFRTTQINDILKSMVLLDAKGTVRPAIYAAKDPIGRTLQSFAVDVSQPTDRVSLLNRLKGAQVVVEGGGTVIAASTMTEKFSFEGQLVGVDKESADARGSQGNILTILGATGMQSVKLDEVRSIRFLDDAVNREFREALTLQASGSDDKRRQVTLRFDGPGKRTVRVGYVSESPLWKISYRLLIGGAGGGTAAGKPYLQGWALVENTTDEDWNGVHLSLISGRPVSFIQDLYQPLYLPRPVVPPDIVASPYPQVADADVEKKSPEAAPASPVMDEAVNGQFGGGGGFGRRATAGGRGGGTAHAAAAGGPAYAPGNLVAAAAPSAFFTDKDMASSVQAASSGQQVGELFQYSISSPVTLPRQQAAMIPVIAGDIAGDKVSIYNSTQDARFPLNAFRLRNNTPLHLKGGPVTIFDDGTYAGDARMEDVPPGATRLVTYAVDLAVTGECVGPLSSGGILSVSLRQGVLLVKRKDRQTTKYTLTSKADKPRLVLVEVPYDPQRTLIQTPPAKEPARTSTNYRFEVAVPPGKTENLTVVTERVDSQTTGVFESDPGTLQYYVSSSDVLPNVKAALREVIARRNKVKALQEQVSAAEAEIAAITADQDRIHKNMADLDRTSALYKRYVGQLDAQETRIQALRTDDTRLHAAVAAAEQDLRAYIATIDIAS